MQKEETIRLLKTFLLEHSIPQTKEFYDSFSKYSTTKLKRDNSSSSKFELKSLKNTVQMKIQVKTTMRTNQDMTIYSMKY